MTISRHDFFRLLPKALAGYKFEISDSVIQVAMKTGAMTIRLQSEATRKIGALELPVLNIIFAFNTVADIETDKFIHKFDLVYQKGGG
jgi:hypothetical protein